MGFIQNIAKSKKTEINFAQNQDIKNHPTIVASYKGFLEFAKWKGARLPTEAEWEFVAKVRNITKEGIYSGSNQSKKLLGQDETRETKLILLDKKTK